MQFFLYLIVGGLSFFVDIGSFIVLRATEVPVIRASVTSFIFATAANYWCLRARPVSPQHRNPPVFSRCVDWVRSPHLAKIIAVPIVLVWNYLRQRRLVFGNEIPAGVGVWLKLREADLTL